MAMAYGLGRFAVVLLLAAAGCGPARTVEFLEPTRRLTDTNPDPAIVEVELVAALGEVEYLPGKKAQVWGYRDGAKEGSRPSVPGPMLEMNAGELIVVHFRNELPQPTTVHWHGLRLPAGMDGSTSSQRVVDPGETFEYRFEAKDPGSFWYHPHVRGDEQVEKGLYGPLVVRGGAAVDVAADRYFVLDDVKLTADGRLSEETDSLDLMLGRQGNVLLVNGRKTPTVAAAPGSRERWRFVNSANGRYFNLTLEGHVFRVISWDGGLLPAPYLAQTLLIAPGERYEVLVELQGAPGERLRLQTLHYDRGHNTPVAAPRDLLAVELGAEASRPAEPLPTLWRELPRLPWSAATYVRPMVLQETESASGVRFAINNQMWPLNQPEMAKLGDIELWSIQNTTEMDHPFHLHGMFFEVVDVDGRPPTHFGWKDTVNVPKQATLRFAVRYEPVGMWMFHCHILEHAERGMMGDLMVMP